MSHIPEDNNTTPQTARILANSPIGAVDLTKDPSPSTPGDDHRREEPEPLRRPAEEPQAAADASDEAAPEMGDANDGAAEEKSLGRLKRLRRLLFPKADDNQDDGKAGADDGQEETEDQDQAVDQGDDGDDGEDDGSATPTKRRSRGPGARTVPQDGGSLQDSIGPARESLFEWWARRTARQRFILSHGSAAAFGAYGYGLMTAQWDVGLPQLVLSWMTAAATESEHASAPLILGGLVLLATAVIGGRLSAIAARWFHAVPALVTTAHWAFVRVPVDSVLVAVLIFSAPN